MSKKYLYNLGKGLQEYSIEEISKHLELDKDFIEAILDTEKDDIDYACFEALKEKTSKKNIMFLFENFSTRYFARKGVYPLLNDYFDIQNRKKSFINSLEFNLENFPDNHLILSKNGFNLITVNTDINFDKPVYKNDDMDYIKNLKHSFNENSNSLLSSITTKSFNTEEINNSISYNSLILSVDDTKNLLNKAKNFKLPKIYNELVFEEIISDKNACSITYIKK